MGLEQYIKGKVMKATHLTDVKVPTLFQAKFQGLAYSDEENRLRSFFHAIYILERRDK